MNTRPKPARPSSAHELADFMRALTHEMSSEYNRIRKRAREDPGTAGDQGEENWAGLLRRWLPPAYQLVTKGRILSEDGIATPQLDVLVLHPAYPRHLLDKKLYLAAGILAVFECKLTLKAGHITDAMKNSVEIRRDLPKRIGSPYKELHSPITYGLLAHSHSWKRRGSSPVDNISASLVAADSQFVQHPREMLDLICVADLANWSAVKIAWMNPGGLPTTTQSALTDLEVPIERPVTGYLCHVYANQAKKQSYTPIGDVISGLLSRIAWEDSSIRSIASYFWNVGLEGSGMSTPARSWDAEIYSDAIRPRILAGRVGFVHRSHHAWDEWQSNFHI